MKNIKLQIHIFSKNHHPAFALPAILIISILMITILVSAVSATSSVLVGTNASYYDSLSREAAASGIARAKDCVAQNGGTITWTAAKPLKASTDCNGDPLPGVSCPSDPRCYVSKVETMEVDFVVTTDGTTYSSEGTTNLLRKSNGSVWKRYSAKGEKPAATTAPVVAPIVAAGGYHSCATATNNNAYCWGYNVSGQLGNNSTSTTSSPVAVNTSGVLSGKTIIALTSGGYQNCAIASDNNAYCWGSNEYGQLGNNSTSNSSVPVAVNTSGALSGKTIKTISSGDSHTCAIASDNNAYCWGDNSSGRLGYTTVDYYSTTPAAVNTSGALSGKTIKIISSGNSHTCAIASDNNAYCWGGNSYGQLGNGSTTSSTAPVAVNTSGVLSGKTIKSISVAFSHTCAIASDNLAYCWGSGTSGKLGNGSATSSTTPVAVNTSGVLSGKTIMQVSNGGNSTCVIASDNRVYCWGSNSNGELGDGTNTTTANPVAVSTSGVLAGKTITSVSLSLYYSSCAMSNDSKVYCWGRGAEGQLGNGSTAATNVPVAVSVYP